MRLNVPLSSPSVARRASAFHNCRMGTSVYTRACVLVPCANAFLPPGKINDLPSAGTIQSAATLYVSLSTVRRAVMPKVEQNHIGSTRACVGVHTLVYIYIYTQVYLSCACMPLSPMRIDLFPSRSNTQIKMQMQM